MNQNNEIKVIGITGGIGSGKTAVVNILKSIGAKIINADEISRQIVRPGEAAYSEIVKVFGKSILYEGGTINRKLLADIVFKDKVLLNKLNNITHTKVAKCIINKVSTIKKTGSYKIIALEVVIPIKHGFLDIADVVWFIKSDINTRVERVKKRSNLSSSDAYARINAQPSDEEYEKISNVVINNNDTIDKLFEKVMKEIKNEGFIFK